MLKKKRIRRAAPKPPAPDLASQLKAEKAAHRLFNRKNKRKMGKLVNQVNKWRKKCRDLKDENKRLRETIEELRKGQHDIVLKGDSQDDMQDLMAVCRTSPILERNLAKQDDTSGTLTSFWQEQVSRCQDPNKRRRWNPIVLRFMLNLWQQMGEKNFRVLGEENVSEP